MVAKIVKFEFGEGAYWNRERKKELLELLHEIDPDVFEDLIGQLLECLGFENVQVIGRSGDGGIDVRGVLTVGGVTQVRTAIQAKRWRKNIAVRIVRELRGSLGPRDQGLIITTSAFTKNATSEATISDRAPITLVDGMRLVDLLAEQALGLKSKDVFEIDQEMIAGKVPGDADGRERRELESTRRKLCRGRLRRRNATI